MTKLTGKQQVVLEFIQRYVAEHHRAPYIREIQSGCGIASYKSTVDRVNALERKGYLKRRPNKHRGIRLSRHTPEAAMRPEPVLASAGDGEMVSSNLQDPIEPGATAGV